MIKKFALLLLAIMMMFTSAYSVINNNDVLAYYTLENLSDSTSNNIDLSNSGATLGAIGIIDDAVSFSLDDYLDTGESNYFRDNYNGSVNMWVNSNDISSTKFILGDRVSGTGETINWMTISTGSSGEVVLNYDLGNEAYVVVSNQTITTGTWYMITHTWGSRGMELYINGVLVGTDPWQGSWKDTGSGTNMRIGGIGQYPGLWVDGKLDEVLFTNTQIEQTDIITLYNTGSPGTAQQYPFSVVEEVLELNIGVLNPMDEQYFTFDVENTSLQISTNLNSTCDYTYNAVTTQLSTSNNLTHTESYFDLGVATNNTKQFDVSFYCEEVTNSSINKTANVTFYQNQEPLELTLSVPVDGQQFDSDTNLITFVINTNYQSNCEYLVYNMSGYQEFQNTNNHIHSTDYTAFYPDNNQYNTSFTCNGTILNESVTTNLTFYLLEEVIENLNNTILFSNSLTQITGQLPQVGSDTSGFIDGVRIGAVPLIFALSFIVIIGSLIAGLVIFINNTTKSGMKK